MAMLLFVVAACAASLEDSNHGLVCSAFAPSAMSTKTAAAAAAVTIKTNNKITAATGESAMYLFGRGKKEQQTELERPDAPEIAIMNSSTEEVEEKPEEEQTETQKLMKQVKDAGLAGVISYATWELVFWAISLPVVLVGYYGATGHYPDISGTRMM